MEEAITFSHLSYAINEVFSARLQSVLMPLWLSVQLIFTIGLHKIPIFRLYLFPIRSPFI